MPQVFVASREWVAPLLAARAAGHDAAETSLDLGLTRVHLEVTEAGARLPDGSLLPWEALAEIDAAEQNCFALDGGACAPIRVFSEATGRLCSLMPTSGAPTLLIAGIPMHRIKGVDPYQDTLNKMRAIGRLRGRVLDTSTGLGYTAIEAARSAEQVVTIEIDPAVLEVARLNPWSRDLFQRANITQITGDSYEEVAALPEASFDAIIHDPPAMRLTGDLYSGEMYRRLYRVLRDGGRLFHYIGDPDSKSGRSVTRGVALRLEEAGFGEVRPRPQAFGLLARKGGRGGGRRRR
jgi:predicted methyltransferase